MIFGVSAVKKEQDQDRIIELMSSRSIGPLIKPSSSIIVAGNQKRSQEHTGIEAFPDRHNHFAAYDGSGKTFQQSDKKLC